MNCFYATKGMQRKNMELAIRKMEYLVCHEHGTKKTSEFAMGIEPMTFRTPVGCSNHWATGGLVASKVTFTRFIVTCVQHTAKINNDENNVCEN